MDKETLKPVIEALIFAADHPISIDRLATVLEGAEREDIKAAVIELQEDYSGTTEDGLRRGIFIEEVAGGFQLRTRAEHSAWIKRFFKVGMQKISKAAMETLAIVAYKQPLIRAELESIRGVDSAGVLKTLLERRLVKIVGRQDAPGRPVLYGTTKEFLETFELKDLAGLPTLREIEEFEDDSALEGDVLNINSTETKDGEAEELEAKPLTEQKEKEEEEDDKEDSEEKSKENYNKDSTQGEEVDPEQDQDQDHNQTEGSLTQDKPEVDPEQDSN